MWLSGMSYPDHNTINRFRSDRLNGVLKEVFSQVVLLLVENGHITLKEAYLKTLAVGSYNFEAQFKEKSVVLTLNIQPAADVVVTPVADVVPAVDAALTSPATGDRTNNVLWILASAVSILTIGAFTLDVKRRKKTINN